MTAELFCGLLFFKEERIMKTKNKSIFLVLLVLLFLQTSCAPEVPEPESTESPTLPPYVLSLSDVYENREEYLDTIITVEGFYSFEWYDSSEGPAYLFDNYDRVLSNSAIPIESVLILFENIPEYDISSAFLEITGRLVEYADDYPEYIHDNGKFLSILVESWEIIKDPFIKIEEHVFEDISLETSESDINCLWVLIISGSPYTFPGTNLTATYHNRYWNDTLFAYQTVVRLGAQWIRVLHSSGVAPAAFPGMIPGNIPGADMQAATRMNLGNAFAQIGNNMQSNCELWILTTDHGVGWDPPNKIGIGPGNNYIPFGMGRIDGAPADAIVPEGDLFPGDENLPGRIGVGNVVNLDRGDDIDEGLVLWEDIIYDDSFVAELDVNVNQMLDAQGFSYDIFVMMEQCFSGGFIADLEPYVTNVATAASEDQVSWGFSGWPVFDEFFFWFIAALNQGNPVGIPMWPVIMPIWPGPGPDFDGNGIVDWGEAYLYALAMDTRPENPQYR